MLETIKLIIKTTFVEADCGIFFDRNLTGSTTTLWANDRVRVDVCCDCFEIFGLTEEEKTEVKEYYENLLEEEKRILKGE